MDDERDLNLNNDYFVMYGTDEDPVNRPLASLGRHTVNPLLSGQPLNIAVDVTPAPIIVAEIDNVTVPVSAVQKKATLLDNMDEFTLLDHSQQPTVPTLVTMP